MNVTGYLLMQSAASAYRGVSARIYAWPHGEGDAELIQVFMEHTHDKPFDFAFRELAGAHRARRLAGEGDLELVFAQIADNPSVLEQAPLPIGIDVAYPGGDFYSAIYNGLLNANASNDLQSRYGKKLNAHQLFDSPTLAAEYLADFRSVAPSEHDSVFVFYSLGSLERVQ